MEKLLEIMNRLRDPNSGCPWDLEQTFETIAPYTIEEAYEVADAIERKDFIALQEELGDLLFQTVFHSQLAKEAGIFSFADVVATVSDKMVRRHPHVFSEETIQNADEQTIAWEEQKTAERKAKGRDSLLDDIPLALPALTRAVKLQNRAARIGFDWPKVANVVEKMREELDELTEAVDSEEVANIEEEYGDFLFAAANLARHLNIDPEKSMRQANRKFQRRFAFIELAFAKTGRDLMQANLEELESVWDQAKKAEGDLFKTS